jgi:hypothetical protein
MSMEVRTNQHMNHFQLFLKKNSLLSEKVTSTHLGGWRAEKT